MTPRPPPAIQRPNCRPRAPRCHGPGADMAGTLTSWGPFFDGACGASRRRGAWDHLIRRFDRRRPEAQEHPKSVMPLTLLDIILNRAMLVLGSLGMHCGFLCEGPSL